MKFIIRKFNQLFLYISQGVLFKYIVLKIIPGFKVIEKNEDKVLIKTRFDRIIYELPTTNSTYLYVAYPSNELLLSTYINLERGTFNRCWCIYW